MLFGPVVGYDYHVAPCNSTAFITRRIRREEARTLAEGSVPPSIREILRAASALVSARKSEDEHLSLRVGAHATSESSPVRATRRHLIGRKIVVRLA